MLIDGGCRNEVFISTESGLKKGESERMSSALWKRILKNLLVETSFLVVVKKIVLISFCFGIDGTFW